MPPGRGRSTCTGLIAPGRNWNYFPEGREYFNPFTESREIDIKKRKEVEEAIKLRSIPASPTTIIKDEEFPELSQSPVNKTLRQVQKTLEADVAEVPIFSARSPRKWKIPATVVDEQWKRKELEEDSKLFEEPIEATRASGLEEQVDNTSPIDEGFEEKVDNPQIDEESVGESVDNNPTMNNGSVEDDNDPPSDDRSLEHLEENVDNAPEKNGRFLEEKIDNNPPTEEGSSEDNYNLNEIAKGEIEITQEICILENPSEEQEAPKTPNSSEIATSSDVKIKAGNSTMSSPTVSKNEDVLTVSPKPIPQKKILSPGRGSRILGEPQLQRMIRKIKERGLDEAGDKSRFAKIQLFVDFCHIGAVERIVFMIYKREVHVNDGLTYNWSALHHACYSAQKKVVTMLLELGADPNYSRDEDQCSVLHACASYPYNEDDGAHECAQLVIDAGGAVNHSMAQGYTPLILAVRNRHYKMAQMFCEHGADLNHVDSDGRTALDWSKMMKNDRMTMMLQSHMTPPFPFVDSDLSEISDEE